MKKVTGIGGIFFKSKDTEKLKSWYQEHLGIEPDEGGYVQFHWREKDDPDTLGFTVWGPFSHDTKYFAPSKKPFMVNFRVDDLHALLAELRKEGVRVDDKTEEDEQFGKFGWILDPEGTRIELWEPPKKKRRKKAAKRSKRKAKKVVAKVSKKARRRPVRKVAKKARPKKKSKRGSKRS